jgi:hypothetical protein
MLFPCNFGHSHDASGSADHLESCLCKQSSKPSISTQPLPVLWLNGSITHLWLALSLSLENPNTSLLLNQRINHFHRKTMTSSEVAQKPAKTQQVAANQQPQYAREEKEQSASASASAGVCFESRRW